MAIANLSSRATNFDEFVLAVTACLIISFLCSFHTLVKSQIEMAIVIETKLIVTASIDWLPRYVADIVIACKRLEALFESM
jgi:hypothetical protein